MSPAIQNEVINACNDFILADVVKKVNAARCCSVVADKTADISGTKQFAMCARYMDCAAGVVREDFLQLTWFIKAHLKSQLTLIIPYCQMLTFVNYDSLLEGCDFSTVFYVL